MTTTHPWAKIREDRQLTQLEVSIALNVTRQTVIRLEQSLFHAPSLGVLRDLADLYEVDWKLLFERYQEFTSQQREAFKERHPDFSSLRYYERGMHPLVFYRVENDLTRMGFCKGLCLDYGPVADFERNKQRAIPEALKLASKAIGWDLEPLEESVKRWRIKWR